MNLSTMHIFGTLCAFVAMLVCMSTASPVLAPTYMLHPRMPAMEPIVDADSLTVGTFVLVPAAAADGTKTKSDATKKAHLAVILGPVVDWGQFKGLYPIAYISHHSAHTAIVNLTPEIQGVGKQISLTPGRKSRAAMVNMYKPKIVVEKATQAQVDEMKKIWDLESE